MKKMIMFFMLVAEFVIISVSTTNAVEINDCAQINHHQPRLKQQLIDLASVNKELRVILVKLLQKHHDFLELQLKYMTYAIYEATMEINISEFKQWLSDPAAMSPGQAEANREKLARLKEDKFWLSKGLKKYLAEKQESQEDLNRYERKKYFFEALVLVVGRNPCQECWPQLKIQLEKENEFLVKRLSVVRKKCACMK